MRRKKSKEMERVNEALAHLKREHKIADFLSFEAATADNPTPVAYVTFVKRNRFYSFVSFFVENTEKTECDRSILTVKKKDSTEHLEEEILQILNT